jgi:hypothetical protein
MNSEENEPDAIEMKARQEDEDSDEMDNKILELESQADDSDGDEADSKVPQTAQKLKLTKNYSSDEDDPAYDDLKDDGDAYEIQMTHDVDESGELALDNENVSVCKKRGSRAPQAEQAGKPDVVEQCKQSYLADPRPRKIGGVYCFWYDLSNRPRIVIGPDWGFLVVKGVLWNAWIAVVTGFAWHYGNVNLVAVGIALAIVE